MGKGDDTRQIILDRALGLASMLGLDGLTIGKLADELKLSKSGLFAHFRSKEALQKQVLQTASEQFTDAVIRPALKAPRGLPRVQALFERWIDWVKARGKKAGCIFISAAAELDDKPGKLRDYLVETQRQWFATRVRVAETAVAEGHFKKNLDCEQFAHDLYGILMAFHYSARLMRDPRAEERARNAFRSLMEQAIQTH